MRSITTEFVTILLPTLAVNIYQSLILCLSIIHTYQNQSYCQPLILAAYP
jgi:uncharacterized Tic20 family protein